MSYNIHIKFIFTTAANSNSTTLPRSSRNTSLILAIEDEYIPVIYLIPPKWAINAAWAVMYTWLAVALAYSLSTLCRKGPYQTHLYMHPPLNPPSMFIGIICYFLCMMAWMAMYDRVDMIYAFIPFSVTNVTLIFAQIVAIRSARRSIQEFTECLMTRELVIVSLTTHNALMLANSWLICYTSMFLNLVLDDMGISSIVSGYCMLAILGVVIIVWFIMDVFILDKYVRYMVSPYVVVLFTLTTGLINTWDINQTLCLVSLGVVGIIAILTVAKTVILVYRHMRKPLAVKQFL